ncbi:glycosyltransferase [Paenibacillus sp. R14(2021)]|uniref:glycosyltransferase n=1 Tax=Paenibacillus sp. R14(2021) TaxID=2859228 RepID=UPI001C61135D|nr:glycosyltransferase [Paenibacillus sp. R14(2021)]
MNKLNILYFTINWSTFTYKPDHYFKLELAKLPDVRVHFKLGVRDGKKKNGGHLPDILNKLEFVPDFIFFDDFESIRGVYGLPTGMNTVNIPKGILFHDVNRINNDFSSYVKEHKIELVFAHYRDAFLNYFPQYRNRFRWLPNHVYKPVFRRYKVEKTIDYLMMGKINQLYPLRKKIYREMQNVKGFVSHGHPGYKWVSEKEKKRLFIDEKYAKEINRAKMFLTCGSKYDFAVGKYFEIPACGTLLLASGFHELEDLGFIHKKTFIEINKSNFMDMAQYYLRHEDARNAIAEKGYELVHSRHTTDIRVREFVDELWRFTGKTR